MRAEVQAGQAIVSHHWMLAHARAIESYRERRFGLVHVDFETQERVWKDSAYDYQSYIRNDGFN